MENFRPSSNESSDEGDSDSESHESFDDSENSTDNTETDSGNEAVDEKKSVFFSKEELPEESAEGFFSQGGLMDSLLGDASASGEHEVVDGEGVENFTVAEQFSDIVDERASEVISNGSAESAAGADFLENVADGMSVEGVDPTTVIESAAQDVIADTSDAELGIEEVPSLPDMDHISEILNPLGEISPDDEPEVIPVVTPTVLAAAPLTAMPPGPPPPPMSPPPMPPMNPAMYDSPLAVNLEPNMVSSALNSAPTANPNQAPVGTDLAPDAHDESRMNSLYTRDKNTGRVLLGGAIGYLVGKRRGRKKTEALLQPKIDKLDDKVDKLEDKLDQGEDLVKQQAKAQEKLQVGLREAHDKLKNTAIANEFLQKEAQEASVAAETPIEKIDHIAMNAAAEKVALEKQEHKMADLLTIDNTPNPPEVEYSRRVEDLNEEASEIKNSSAKVPGSGVEIKPNTKEVNIRTPDVKTMRVSELLEVARSIKVNSISLKDLYESKRIDVVNLRRIVQEHTRGGNIDKLVNGATEAVELRRELRNEAMPEETVFDLAAVSSGIERKDAQSRTVKPQQGVNMGSAGDLNVPSVGLGHDSRPPANSKDAVSTVIEKDPTLQVSTNTAIVLGVITGIIITGVVLLYSGAL